MSILLIIILSETLLHKYKSSRNGYINSVIINLRLNCLFDAKHPTFHSHSLCNEYISSMRAPIRYYIDNKYNLHEKNIPIHQHENYLTTTFELINDTYSFDKNKLQKMLEENSKEIIENFKLIILKRLNLELALTASKYNGLFSKSSFETQYKYTLGKSNIELRKLFLNDLEFMNKDIIFVKNINFKDTYSFHIEKTSLSKKIPSKFDRLNYLNVFIVSLMLGIFLNITFFILLELKKKLHEITFKI